MVKLTKLFSIGHQKEQQAKAWLSQKDINIIAENYLCKGGEIDLIGVKHQQLFFFEVKYRKQTSYGHPAETVTAKKQQRIILCAQNFLLKHPQYQDFSMQFDVITFTGKDKTPEWIENAFQTF
ncbi:YraN family protein [Thiomicrorhabdus sp. Milos-T2]|uniref:YraN family protein n=1 Tax=Thiomicrorhabdus sp. Milos-T2 TaxID=90814 RepID=UPI00049490B3|nr:YraN family protein [Thiomicrorhabdus sp. Milos-T2]